MLSQPFREFVTHDIFLFSQWLKNCYVSKIHFGQKEKKEEEIVLRPLQMHPNRPVHSRDDVMRFLGDNETETLQAKQKN